MSHEPEIEKTTINEERFANILNVLDECRKDGDTEVAHAVADDALCMALLIAAGDEAHPIIEAYNQVEKWYA